MEIGREEAMGNGGTQDPRGGGRGSVFQALAPRCPVDPAKGRTGECGLALRQLPDGAPTTSRWGRAERGEKTLCAVTHSTGPTYRPLRCRG